MNTLPKLARAMVTYAAKVLWYKGKLENNNKRLNKLQRLQERGQLLRRPEVGSIF